MKNRNYSLHFLCLAAITLLGNAIICAPYKNSNKYNFFAFLVSASAFLLLCIVGDKAANKVLCKPIPKALKILFCAATLPLLIYDAVICFKDYTGFVSKVILPKTATATVMIITLVAVLFLTLKDDSVLLKFSLVNFGIIAVITVGFFLLSLPHLRGDNILIFNTPDIKSSLNQGAEYFLKVFIAALPAVIYEYQKGEKNKKRQSYKGYFAGILLLGVALLNSIMLFGIYTASKTDYPYSSAISTVSIGGLFTRMDGFAYYTFFVTFIVKTTVCLKVALTFFKSIKQLQTKG